MVLKQLSFYFLFVILIETGSTLYFQNCSYQSDKYISCDGNRKSDCYYKVLYQMPSEWQLDGWIECPNCLVSSSLILQNNNKFNLNFTTRNEGKDFWQGILVNVTFQQANEIKSLRRWFILKNTVTDLNSLNYNCITAGGNSDDYKIDFIKVYNQNKRYSLWNSEWADYVTAKNVGNDIWVYLNTPPRGYNFSGLQIFLTYPNKTSKIVVINNTAMQKFGKELNASFEDIPTDNYTVMLGATNDYCECDPTKEPYMPDLSYEDDLCNCRFLQSEPLKHVYNPNLSKVYETRHATTTTTTTMELQSNSTAVANLKSNLTISLRDAITAICVGIAFVCCIVVVMIFLVVRNCRKENVIINIHYFGSNSLNNKLADDLKKINRDYNKRISCDEEKASPSAASASRSNLALLIHENECGVLGESTAAEHRCSCLASLENETKNVGVLRRLVRTVLFKKLRIQNSTFVFPDQAEDLCKLICGRESGVETVFEDLMLKINEFIGEQDAPVPPTGNPTSNPTGNTTGNHIGNPTGNPTSNPIGNHTGNPTGNPIVDDESETTENTGMKPRDSGYYSNKSSTKKNNKITADVHSSINPSDPDNVFYLNKQSNDNIVIVNDNESYPDSMRIEDRFNYHDIIVNAETDDISLNDAINDLYKMNFLFDLTTKKIIISSLVL